ncbi:MAG: hypothetical protein GY863_05430 [bacterium]|nr:hypothetical protein [bacterium]
MFRRKKKEAPRFEQFENFHLQVKLDCEGKDDTLFFELDDPINNDLLEYFKPFGELIPLSGDIYEISCDNFFRIRIPLGKTSIIAELPKEHDPYARIALINQIKFALKEQGLPPDFEKKCPEYAINVSEGKMKIDRKKCTFCLDCIIRGE